MIFRRRKRKARPSYRPLMLDTTAWPSDPVTTYLVIDSIGDIAAALVGGAFELVGALLSGLGDQ